MTAIVAAGLLAMPSRLLGPEQDRLTPINLPRVASPAIVVAVRPAVVIPAAKPVRRPVPSAPVAQLASVVVHATAPTQPAPAAHKASAAHGMTAARVTVVNRVARHPLPTDEARAATHPTPAPTPEPVPAPAPAAPAPAPAPAPAAPRVLAYSASTVPQTPSDDTNANCPDDGHNGNGKGNGNGNGNGNAGANAGDQHGQAHGNGNGNGTGTGTARSRFRRAAAASRHNAAMPRSPFTRRVGPFGTALLIWDVWRRLPPTQRRWMVDRARVHGPRLVKQALDAQKSRRKR